MRWRRESSSFSSPSTRRGGKPTISLVAEAMVMFSSEKPLSMFSEMVLFTWRAERVGSTKRAESSTQLSVSLTKTRGSTSLLPTR